jgi:ABC-type phosphate/phosphonate transport system substrate-binding protein
MRAVLLLRYSIMLCAFLMLAVTTLVAAPLTGAALDEILPKFIHVGFSTRILSDIDPRDAQAAMELWTRELSQAMGIKVAPQTVIFRNTSDMLAALKRGELSIVSLTAIDYLKIRKDIGLIPSVVAPSNVGKGRNFLLIARRDSGIGVVADLQGKTINLPSAIKQEVSHIWLDVLLMREGKRDCSSFFRQVKEYNSPTQAIMAVFFRQADAAIVSRGALETSNALNPQIGSQLLVVSESQSMIGDFSCIPTTVNQRFRESIEYAALHLHEKPKGKQIFTLFHIEKVVPFQPSYLDGTVELLRERDRLLAKLGKRR